MSATAWCVRPDLHLFQYECCCPHTTELNAQPTPEDRLQTAGHYVRRPTGHVSQTWQRNGYQEGLLDALAALERGGEDGLRTWCRDNLDPRIVRALGPLVQAAADPVSLACGCLLHQPGMVLEVMPGECLAGHGLLP